MSALEDQVGGGHYKDMAIQPAVYIHKNNIGFLEGGAIKYLSRWRKKNGIQDLKKAIHMIELLIEMEYEKEDDTLQEHYQHMAEWDEDRMDAIGQNGNDGAVYDELYWHERQ